MTKDRREGIRKNRYARIGKKPELGYYVIVVNTKETENNYFNGLKNSLPCDMQRKLAIVVFKAKTCNMLKVCKERIAYDPQNRKGWIIFDRDQETYFDKLIENAESEKIGAGWSNPCFEIWLYAYYGEMPFMRNEIPEKASQECCGRFGKIFADKNKIEYSKSEAKLYSYLMQTGDERKAISIAHDRLQKCQRDCNDKKISEWPSCTNVFKLIAEIREKSKRPKEV